ncbi:MAG: hypothetical protein A2161_12510 [Candidatus Schekmanbacteria bacterium RBG_13_48_7]|uniref:Sigma-54 factor interaction domain-containing protein n=1 Tax=Candidatus Schekmanbacteria bacterium RBG_13_48_7 TaxID=1817878 RepID=A0A1F7S0C8_9BACT|nr:MAG: hypothetical protein A2161_12510 [Candidatus Schekmanbacteria bacterium RBG_13_48_7]
MFRDEDIRLMEIFANTVSVAIDNFREFKELKENSQSLITQIKHLHRLDEIIYESSPMREITAILQKATQSDVTVLIEGESGTGKELIANYLHYNGTRCGKPFVAVNCAEIQPTLSESILFGHKKGSFTGAISSQKGLVEAANQGTLFLDEISNLHPTAQAQLLRFIETKTFRLVGGNDDIKVDVRLIAASNQNLENEIKNGQFRTDLFYRINVLRIVLPPLRERIEDIPLLIQHFMKKYRSSPHPIEIAPETLKILEAYHWPGNIRELRNEIEKIHTLYNTSLIKSEHLSDRIRYFCNMGTSGRSPKLKEARDNFEKQLIIDALQKHSGNRTHTSRYLGLTRTNLNSKMKKYRIVFPS